jgi:hypothetical protein
MKMSLTAVTLTLVGSVFTTTWYPDSPPCVAVPVDGEVGGTPLATTSNCSVPPTSAIVPQASTAPAAFAALPVMSVSIAASCTGPAGDEADTTVITPMTTATAATTAAGKSTNFRFKRRLFNALLRLPPPG